MKFILKSFILKLNIITFFFIFLFIIFNGKIKYKDKNHENNNQIKYYYDFKNIKIPTEIVKKLLKYINYSKNGILLYKQNLIKSQYPKVTIVISMYNRDEFINSTIKSVQNQRMKEIEIIIVDDFSIDNSVKYVEEAQKSDSRIILIKNKKKMGTLFCKSIGVLYSKAKYILPLDSDDMICFENYTEILYEESEKGNYDYIICDYIFIDLHKKTISLIKNFRAIVLWQKFIKAEVYKKIIFRIGNNILNQGIIQSDDHFIDIFLNKFFHFKHLNLIGIFHFIHYKNQQWDTRFINKETKNKFCEDMLKTIDSLYDVSDNNRKSKLYSFNHLRSLFINSKCFKNEKIREKTIQLFIKFYKSNFF